MPLRGQTAQPFPFWHQAVAPRRYHGTRGPGRAPLKEGGAAMEADLVSLSIIALVAFLCPTR